MLYIICYICLYLFFFFLQWSDSEISHSLGPVMHHLQISLLLCFPYIAIISTLNHSISNMSPCQQQLDFPLGLIAVLVLNHILDPLTEIGTVRAERGVAMASG